MHKNVDFTVMYESTGSISTDVKPSDDIEAAEQKLENAIADVLGIHDTFVEVDIDPETGIATYTVTDPTVDGVKGLQNAMDVTNILHSLNEKLADIEVSDVAVSDEVIAVV